MAREEQCIVIGEDFTVLREEGEPRSLLIPILSIRHCEVVLIPRENLAVLDSCDILKR